MNITFIYKMEYYPFIIINNELPKWINIERDDDGNIYDIAIDLDNIDNSIKKNLDNTLFTIVMPIKVYRPRTIFRTKKVKIICKYIMGFAINAVNYVAPKYYVIDKDRYDFKLENITKKELNYYIQN